MTGPGRLCGLRRAAMLFAMATMAWPAAALPSFDEVRAAHRPSDLTLLDRHGVPIQTLRTDLTVRRLPWVPLAQVSPALRQAIVLSEDRRFWDHAGVDWAAIAASAWANAWNTRTRGASTLTMQLAGLVDDGLARPAEGRSLGAKLGQVLVAAQLESRWRKDQILEAYLNSVPFRGELVGIGALSQQLFGKRPEGLDTHEAAIAAALVRAPNARPDAVAARACGVLRLQRLDCTGLDAMTGNALARRGGPMLGEQIAPHLARRVLKPDGPAEQRSTVDARLQRLVRSALRTQLAELQGRQVEDGAVLVLDNATGEVLAWVGSSGSMSDAPEVDGVLARRQPGSTLKPFVYGLAFERRLITPATLLDDRPARIATASGLYQPHNYDERHRGWVSARAALASSLNVPAVRVGQLLGPDALVERLNALGFALPHPGGWYGESLALGGAEVSLLALTQAYRTLANGGMASPVRLRPDEPRRAPTRVLDEAAAWLVADILADPAARAPTFGLASALALRTHASVKTGTSKDLRDNWCVGFTPQVTVGVWVGNAAGGPMHDVSGTSGAAPVWHAVMGALHEGRPQRVPVPPAGLVRATVLSEDASAAPREEWLMAGTRPPGRSAGTAMPASPAAGIVAPRPGAVYALDPDIPAARQRVVFEGQHGTWRLDGRLLGHGASLPWAPVRGRHRLQLLAADGRVLAETRFEVR